MKCTFVVFLVIIGITLRVEAAPRRSGRPPVNCMYGAMENCDLNSGPVCAIDSSGIPETFENQCMAFVAACQKYTFFVQVKPGEC